MRFRFQNHVILVQLRVHRVDLALPEGVVERVVDRRRGDSQARRRRPVDDQGDRESSGLLIRGHVFEVRQFFQFRDKTIGPVV